MLFERLEPDPATPFHTDPQLWPGIRHSPYHVHIVHRMTRQLHGCSAYDSVISARRHLFCSKSVLNLFSSLSSQDTYICSQCSGSMTFWIWIREAQNHVNPDPPDPDLDPDPEHCMQNGT